LLIVADTRLNPQRDRNEYEGEPGGEYEREGQQSPATVLGRDREVGGGEEHDAAGREQRDRAGEERGEDAAGGQQGAAHHATAAAFLSKYLRSFFRGMRPTLK
jgi:hypothetical protein